MTNMKVNLNPLSMEQFHVRALDSKFKEPINIEINHWKDSLENMLKSEL